ncbi:hypothetical protein JTB14_018943 [Gonioctena quinquepunctata]|nr:hypothetical protein JTB14_018943 [Gonioctena quinquepunctata]
MWCPEPPLAINKGGRSNLIVTIQGFLAAPTARTTGDTSRVRIQPGTREGRCEIIQAPMMLREMLSCKWPLRFSPALFSGFFLKFKNVEAREQTVTCQCRPNAAPQECRNWPVNL